ncbi:GIY-YIG nuclease family protein [Hymenobacter bucti]|uniref:GIY-YIG nuclease family protein n=1 Tax=Hymenobacter bucti TaxID=1844114 RepID=A0ABW4QXJ7_9BACT
MKRAAWLAQQRGRKAVLYVIRVYSKEEEAFYKVGITYNLAARFRRIRADYHWRTLARYSSYRAEHIWNLEQAIHRDFAHLSYSPAASFSGHTECYAEVKAILAALPAGTFFLKPVNCDI